MRRVLVTLAVLAAEIAVLKAQMAALVGGAARQ